MVECSDKVIVLLGQKKCLPRMRPFLFCIGSAFKLENGILTQEQSSSLAPANVISDCSKLSVS